MTTPKSDETEQMEVVGIESQEDKASKLEPTALLDLSTSIAAFTTFLVIFNLSHFFDSFSFFHFDGISGKLSR